MQKTITPSVGITDELLTAAMDALTTLIHATQTERPFDVGYERALMLISAIPFSTEEYALAKNRLNNARRYAQSGERGARVF